MITVPYKQRGATLMVSLVILVMLTLFAISMINSSSLGLRIVSNFQAQKVMEQGANEELENFISLSSNFNMSTPPAQVNVCVNGAEGTAGLGGSCTGGYRVIIDPPPCLRGSPATGYSKKIGELAPDDVDWEVTASVVDPSVDPADPNDIISKTHMRITEGVRVRMLAGACP